MNTSETEQCKYVISPSHQKIDIPPQMSIKMNIKFHFKEFNVQHEQHTKDFSLNKLYRIFQYFALTHARLILYLAYYVQSYTGSQANTC